MPVETPVSLITEYCFSMRHQPGTGEEAKMNQTNSSCPHTWNERYKGTNTMPWELRDYISLEEGPTLYPLPSLPILKLHPTQGRGPWSLSQLSCMLHCLPFKDLLLHRYYCLLIWVHGYSSLSLEILPQMSRNEAS